MDGHEWPYLVRGNSTKLAPNMTFSDEPGIYIRGEFGVRLEDDMHITENGAELFTPQSPSLEMPFGKLEGTAQARDFDYSALSDGFRTATEKGKTLNHIGR
jgi:hypothetical protein